MSCRGRSRRGLPIIPSWTRSSRRPDEGETRRGRLPSHVSRCLANLPRRQGRMTLTLMDRLPYRLWQTLVSLLLDRHTHGRFAERETQTEERMALPSDARSTNLRPATGEDGTERSRLHARVRMWLRECESGVVTAQGSCPGRGRTGKQAMQMCRCADVQLCSCAAVHACVLTCQVVRRA